MDEFVLSDEHWMKAALREAEKAYQLGEVPIGAVVVYKNQIVGKGHNLTEKLQDPTAHAEMIAITAAANAIGSRRLNECMLYTTLEPCPMCAGALVLSRISRLVYGTSDPKAGAARTLYSICDDPRLNHQMIVTDGVMAEQSSMLLTSFFRELRRKKSER
ncbi:MAG: tRNA adenosine(34) deaminase TadA [Calditrichia bacterium]